MSKGASGPRVRATVLVTVCAGIVGTATVALIPWSYEPRVHATPVWAVVLLALSCVGELAYVRMRHGASAEDLTFYESVVVGGVLLLPPVAATFVPLVALLAASGILRRRPVKTVFNLGSYAASTSAMVVIYTSLAGSQQPFSAQSVAAVVIAAGAFAAVNLVALAAVLSATEQTPILAVIRAEWRLSAFMAVGNVALGAVAVSLATQTPVLLPFAALPALTLGYAYRAVARGADERARTSHLVTLGGVLAAGRPPQSILLEVAKAVHRAFDAATVQALVPSRGWVAAAPADTLRAGGQVETFDADGAEEIGVVQLQLVLGQPSGLAGSRPWRGKPRRLGESERALVTSIVQMLASSLGTAVHADALREETAKLTSVVENASDGIVVLDGTGTVVLWSPALAAITGHEQNVMVGKRSTKRDPLSTLGEVLGATVVEALPPVDLTKALRPDQPYAAVQLTLRRPDGEERHVRASVSALFGADSTVQKMVAIVHDITADERLARLKSDFVATVSHELRTPITPIKGYAHLLATRGNAMGDEQRMRALRVIEDRADHLSKLVDDLLLASKMSVDAPSGLQIEVGAHDVVALVRQAIAGVPNLAARTVFAPPREEVLARCDKTRLNQCLTNILTNAQKYSAPSSAIRVEVSSDADGVTVAVADEGRGIPSDELERIFHRFHRVEDSMTMTTDGTGLGLFITRELARAMGGDVSVTSELGNGSTFTLRLQAPPAAASAA